MKGKIPLARVKSITPELKRSAAKPEYFLPYAISGAM
jgi:hypothetical protein